jgi:GT2 family glycosyltransferase/SAM-dependent methyltransferase
MWAARLVAGRRVLDLASGEGFGAAILAESAASVIGVDTDQRTVDHSQLNYGGDKIVFRVGDAQYLNIFEPDSFDAVVAFEMIEHVDDQRRVLSEIDRVLAPGGLLIASTPDRRPYTLATGVHNPFHVHELDREQFRELLSQKFSNVATWGQRTITGSSLSALDPRSGEDPPAQTFFIEREGDTWGVAEGVSALYLVAVASNAELPAIPRGSTLADAGLGLMRAAEAQSAQAATERWQESEAARARTAQELEHRDVQERELRNALADREVELELRQRRLIEALGRAAADERHIAGLEAQLEVQHSVSWQIFGRVRAKVLAALGGHSSVRARVIRRVLRVVGGVLTGSPLRPGGEPPEPSPIELPQFERPKVSIVVPVHSGASLTRGCLESIRDRTTGIGYEVIVVDDTADQETKALLETVQGAQVIVNPTNLGFLRSMNSGASHARGDWLVLCNNDIQVLDGWLSEMLKCAESSSDIAVVTPKFLYGDWSLNEAGAIVWRDGSAGNYGRGGDPADWRFEFRREVDYGSAAALLVKTDFWRQVGGFDQRFAPIYYEDTDLCFQAREHGLRVMYEPRANVIHLEGSTSGTDVTTGLKRYQEVNRSKFVQKWRRRLDSEQLPASPHNLRRAATRHRGPHVLIVDHRVPMWDRDSGSLRMRGMIKSLIDLGCQVTFLPDDLRFVLPYTVELQGMGVEVYYGDVGVAGELEAIGPGLALVITCRPHTTSRYLDLLRECAPSARIVYDTVDLHWLREARRAGAADGSGQMTLGPRAAVLRELELALIRSTDATLVVTAEEREQAQADVPGAEVRVVPNVNEVRADVPPRQARQGVVFIGGFEHPPNVDAAMRLVGGVMPRVWRELGDVPVTIIGPLAPPEVQALGSPLVEVAGWVADVDPLFDGAAAMVAPLNYGAGLKGKVTQALAAGLPVVTTPIGAEGLDAVDGEQLLIGTDDHELADRIIRVLTDDGLWAALSSAGQRLAAERCSPELMTAALSELLAARSPASAPSAI